MAEKKYPVLPTTMDTDIIWNVSTTAMPTVAGIFWISPDRVDVVAVPGSRAGSWAEMRNTCVKTYFHEIAESTKSIVSMSSQYANVPVIIGGDGEPVPLYRFVSEIDAALDFSELCEQLPTLTSGQIGAGIEFIRRAMQFNTAGLDIEALEDDQIESTPEFQNTIREALSTENVRLVG